MKISSEHIVCVLLYLAVGKIHCQDDLIKDDISKYADTCYLYFFYGDPELPQFIKSTVSSIDDISDALKQNPQYTDRLIIYVHGWIETTNSTSVQTVVKAHLQRGKDYIIVLDWSKWGNTLYTTAVLRANDIAKAMASTLNILHSKNYTFSNLQVIGHSLGAHIAGFIGKYTTFQIPRITGLDPAYPGFYGLNPDHISPNNAKFVDIIHTDGGIYGVAKPTGTVDFYPNGGTRPQPNCSLINLPISIEIFCSHQKSWRYYSATVLNDKIFLATKCKNYRKYRAGKCNNNSQAYYGYNSPTNISGTYYFTTNL